MTPASVVTPFDDADTWLSSHLLVPTERCGRHEPLAGWSWRPRLRDYDLWLVRGGQGTASINDLPLIPLTPGTLLLLRPGDEALMTQDEAAPVSVTFCHFRVLEPSSGAQVAIPDGLTPSRAHRIEPAGPTATTLEALVRVLRRRRTMAGLRSRGLLGQLLASVYALPGRVSPPGFGHEAEAVRRAAAIVDADPARRHTADLVAAAVGLSPRALAPLFRTHLDMSFREYLLESRLRRAQVLVGETDLTIAAIARMLGYADHTLFSKQFHARFGRSPRAYRSS